MISNLVVPVLTPFASSGSVDDDALAVHSGWVVEQGASGVMLFGTTGEGPSLSVAEKLAAARALCRDRPDIATIASVTESSLTESVNCIRGYNEIDLEAVLVLPPYYFRDAGPDGFAAFYDAILAVSEHPVLAYHIPSMAPAVPLGYVGSSGLLGVKDSGGDLAYTDAVLAAGKTVFVGAEGLVPDAVAHGAAGTIAGMGNLVPGMLAELCVEARAGNLERAYELRDRVLSVQRAVLAVAPGLEFLSAFRDIAGRLHGYPLGDPRIPLLRRRDYLTDELLAVLDANGVVTVR